MIIVTTGEKIRIAREQLELTQEAFAKLVNSSRMVVSDVENGKRELRESEIKSWCKVLNISIMELLS